MNDNKYCEAINYFEPDANMKRRIAAAVEAKQRTRTVNLRPLFAGVIAAVLMTCCTIVTVMAVSPEFRQSVFSFFHISQSEQVPDLENKNEASVDNPSVTKSDIGGQVKAQYVQLKGSGYSTGFGTLYKVKQSNEGDIRSVNFWSVENGAASKLNTRKSHFNFSWQNSNYHGNIYWCVYSNELSLYGSGSNWYTSAVPGRTDVAFIYVSNGAKEYPLLYHLDTGKTEDILSGTGAEDLNSAYNYVWTDDLSKLIITDKNHIYYCDVAAKTLTDIKDLTGHKVNSAFFADNKTLILSRLTDSECSCWSYDLASGQMALTVNKAKLYNQDDKNPCGMMFFSGRYGAYVTEAGQLSVFDLKTGAQTEAEGFTFPREGDVISNRSNTKLLYCASDENAVGLGVSKLGVLDLETGSFTVLDREGYDALNEWSLGWFDDDRVEIFSNSQEAAGVYIYEF